MRLALGVWGHVCLNETEFKSKNSAVMRYNGMKHAI